MFEFSTVEFSRKYYYKKEGSQFNKYYCLDCHSGEGQTNQLLKELNKYFILSKASKKQKKKEFDFYLEFFLKKCININRSFSDAVWFLSIWLKISPDTLLSRLKNVKIINELIEQLVNLKNELKSQNTIKNLSKKKLNIKNLINKLNVRALITIFKITDLENELNIEKLIQVLKEINLKTVFNRTEYHHEGDQWYFPRLLQTFSTVVNQKKVASMEVLNDLFEAFDFFNIPEVFVTEIIGYDRLQLCINECPAVFKLDLLSKVNEFAKINDKISLGLRSHIYLQEALEKENYKKKCRGKEGRQLEDNTNNNFFGYPIKKMNNQKLAQPASFTWSNPFRNGYR